MTKFFNKKNEENYEITKPTLKKYFGFHYAKKQICGVLFLHQYSVNYFVIDFYAPQIKLAIEVDGASHIGKEEYDRERQ